MNPTRVVRVVLCLVLALGLSAVVAQPSSAAARRTVVTSVDPVHAGSHLIRKGYRITHTRSSADCHDSLVVRGAGRCFSGNLIFDPCWPFRFHDSDYSGYACLSAPWSKSLTVLRNAGSEKDYTTGRTLWGLQLANGARCSVITGAGDQYHGKFFHYGCTKGTNLIGNPNRTHALWTITAVRRSGGKQHASRVSITRAWYGIGQEGA